MPYIKITQPKLADAIVAELESMILEGSLQPGQKLPPSGNSPSSFRCRALPCAKPSSAWKREDSCIVVRAVALTYKMP